MVAAVESKEQFWNQDKILSSIVKKLCLCELPICTVEQPWFLKSSTEHQWTELLISRSKKEALVLIVDILHFFSTVTNILQHEETLTLNRLIPVIDSLENVLPLSKLAEESGD